MIYVSQLVAGGVYRLHSEVVKIVSIYGDELLEARTITAVIVYDKWAEFGITRSAVRETGYTDFEELTPLEAELFGE